MGLILGTRLYGSHVHVQAPEAYPRWDNAGP